MDTINDLIGRFRDLEDNDGWINTQQAAAIFMELVGLAASAVPLVDELKRQARYLDARIEALEQREQQAMNKSV